MIALPYVYAAMLDVLGYRERLEQDRKHGELGFKDVLERSLRCLAQINDAEFAHQAISDTIIITCSRREGVVEFLRVLKEVQLSFLVNGLFLRGGVTFQQHFKSGVITYSPAYAGAHELESKLAIYPRIVIDHNIIEMFKSEPAGKLMSDSGLLCECNGVYFVNIIDEGNWRATYESAKVLYSRDADSLRRAEGAFNKHVWFQEYLMSSEFASPDAKRYVPAMSIWRLPPHAPPSTPKPDDKSIEIAAAETNVVKT